MIKNNMFTINKKSVGYRGEKIAVKFLKKKGYKIIARNWCNKKGRRLGEIDIIARNKIADEIIFVEVKTRQMNEYDDVIPHEQITPAKLHKLQKVAEAYISENDLWALQWRFDAVSVVINNKKVQKIEHIKNIFF